MSLSNIKCLVRTNQTTKNQLKDIKDGSIIFEYAIPRIGRRIDNILLMNNKFCFCVLKKRGGIKAYNLHFIMQTKNIC